MRILFFVLSIILLPACTLTQPATDTAEPRSQETTTVLSGECDTFPYDESNTPCNQLGWMTFASHSLKQNKAEHKLALVETQGNKYKELILKSSYHESLKTRTEATDALLKIAKTKTGNFADLFYLLATYSKHTLLNKRNVANLKAKLKVANKNNTALQTQLNETQAKIEAIMDIEKNLNTN